VDSQTGSRLIKNEVQPGLGVRVVIQGEETTIE